MEIKNIKITNRSQFEKLVQLMEDNPDIGRGKPSIGSSKKTLGEKWEEFAVELNSLGPPSRIAKEWQRVWIHYKAKVKKKVAINRETILATGGGSLEVMPLSLLEERVTQLAQMTRQITPTGHAFGLENVEPPPLPLSEAASVIPEATNTKPPTPNNKAECNATGGGRYKLLQLSPMEETVANLMQFQRQLTPDGLVCDVQDQGFLVIEGEEEYRSTSACSLPSSNVECEEVLPTEESFTHHQPGNNSASGQEWFIEGIEDLENICSESSNAINGRATTTKKSQRNKKEKKYSGQCLFELHNNMQEKVLNEISRTMNSINNTLKDTRQIEEEKLKLLRRRNEREEELFQNEMKKKKIELEIKKMELQMLKESHVTRMESDQ